MLHFCCQLHYAYLAMTRERQKSAVVMITERIIILNEMGIMTKIQAFQGQILYEAGYSSTLSIVLLLYNFLHHLGNKVLLHNMCFLC